jgi:hypothetical protein
LNVLSLAAGMAKFKVKWPFFAWRYRNNKKSQNALPSGSSKTLIINVFFEKVHPHDLDRSEYLAMIKTRTFDEK